MLNFNSVSGSIQVEGGGGGGVVLLLFPLYILIQGWDRDEATLCLLHLSRLYTEKKLKSHRMRLYSQTELPKLATHDQWAQR